MKRTILMLIAATVLFPFSIMARTYSATFSGNTPASAINVLKKATGYDFVYQKNLLKETEGQVVGNFTDVSLDQLLDYTVGMQLGLDYSIVDKTITLRKGSGKKSNKQFAIKGTVVDIDGEPLPGATVMIQGTNLGIATDVDGKFDLDISKGSQELLVRYVGMKPVVLKINASTAAKPLRIEMHPVESMMSEVVVTGYQNIKRENATGAFTIVKAEDLDKKHSGSIAEGLEGSVPGLTVSHNDNPTANKYGNEEDKFVVRGVGTFSAGTAPLVVVDGLPIEGGLQTVNLYDIDTVTLLKDASASAIYGARASNGVIVITTKKAKQEKLKVDFNIDLTVRDKINYDKAGWANGAQLLELERRNWQGMLAEKDQASLNSLLGDYQSGRTIVSPATQLYLDNYLGKISDSELQSKLAAFAGNNYRREW